jgi:hypothetical protein
MPTRARRLLTVEVLEGRATPGRVLYTLGGQVLFPTVPTVQPAVAPPGMAAWLTTHQGEVVLQPPAAVRATPNLGGSAHGIPIPGFQGRGFPVPNGGAALILPIQGRATPPPLPDIFAPAGAGLQIPVPTWSFTFPSFP